MLNVLERKVLNQITDYFLERIRQKRIEMDLPTSSVAPPHINTGECYNWALVAYLTLGEERVKLHSFDSTGWHAFISIDGLYYDAEHLDGEPNWRKMSRVIVIDDHPDDFLLTQTYDEFVAYWRINPHMINLWRAKATELRYFTMECGM